MPSPSTVVTTELSGLLLINRGKVRDVYQVDHQRYLLVATDRISAFDCILPTPIQRKGAVLTAISVHVRRHTPPAAAPAVGTRDRHAPMRSPC